MNNLLSKNTRSCIIYSNHYFANNPSIYVPTIWSVFRPRIFLPCIHKCLMWISDICSKKVQVGLVNIIPTSVEATQISFQMPDISSMSSIFSRAGLANAIPISMYEINSSPITPSMSKFWAVYNAYQPHLWKNPRLWHRQRKPQRLHLKWGFFKLCAVGKSLLWSQLWWHLKYSGIHLQQLCFGCQNRDDI